MITYEWACSQTLQHIQLNLTGSKAKQRYASASKQTAIYTLQALQNAAVLSLIYSNYTTIENNSDHHACLPRSVQK